MKNFFLTVVTIVATLGLFAQNRGVEFFHGSYSDAFTEAKHLNRNVFVDVYTVWCGPCKMVAEYVFPTEIAGNFFNEKFVNIKVDAEKGEGIEFAKRYNIKAYPTFLVLKPDGTVVARWEGGMASPEDFIKKLEYECMTDEERLSVKHNWEMNPGFSSGLKYLSLFDRSINKREVVEKVFDISNSVQREKSEFAKMVLIHSLPGDRAFDYILGLGQKAWDMLGEDYMKSMVVYKYGLFLDSFLKGEESLTSQEFEVVNNTLNPYLEGNIWAEGLNIKLNIAGFLVRKDNQGLIDYFSGQKNGTPISYLSRLSSDMGLLDGILAGLYSDASEEQKASIKKYFAIESFLIERIKMEYQRLESILK